MSYLALSFVLSAVPLTSGFAGSQHGGASRGVGAYNGAWMVSSEGACTGLGSGQVTIIGGRIIGPNGAGRVSPGGFVRTIQNINGVTVTGQGQISGTMAAGTFRQSDGCSGTWTAVKM